MPKVKISEYSATANSNTDVASINIDEGCAPSGINNAIRAVMGHLKDFQQGTNGDPFNGPVNGTLGATTASTANVTTLTTSSTVTHNGGTANGVAYLNGSKVLTTGSALVFDGTNLGLGVTPSAWDTLLKAITVTNTAVFSGQTNAEGMRLGSNWYYNSGFKYQTTGSASRYDQASGAHSWLTAASGTAGNAITFTQAMTLDASGNLGVNNTSPTTLITSIGGGGGKGMVLSGQVPVLYFEDTNGTDASIFVENGDIAFVNGTTEAARFSSGNLLVGRTTQNTSERLNVTYAPANTGIVVNTSASFSGNSTLINFLANGTQGGVIAFTNNGTSTAYVTSSDYRLKNTIAPMTGALAKVAQLKPVVYKWNADGSDGDGFVAHELAEVCPHAVVGEKDAVDNNGNPKYQGIDTSFLVATLTAAIQELNAKFEEYKAAHP